MPVYSEVFSDEEIINLIGDRYHNILVVGCGSCMNESLAYLHDSSIFVKGNDKEDIPHSVIVEIQRITNSLKKKVITQTIWFYLVKVILSVRLIVIKNFIKYQWILIQK